MAGLGVGKCESVKQFWFDINRHTQKHGTSGYHLYSQNSFVLLQNRVPQGGEERYSPRPVPRRGQHGSHHTDGILQCYVHDMQPGARRSRNGRTRVRKLGVHDRVARDVCCVEGLCVGYHVVMIIVHLWITARFKNYVTMW